MESASSETHQALMFDEYIRKADSVKNKIYTP